LDTKSKCQCDSEVLRQKNSHIEQDKKKSFLTELVLFYFFPEELGAMDAILEEQGRWTIDERERLHFLMTVL
jgi:hypothetical protein